MLGTLVSLLVLVVVVVFFGWLTKRTLGSKHKILKWPLLLLTGLLTLVFALVTMVGAMGTFKLYAPASNPVANVKVAGTPEQIARGAKYATFCANCHSTSGKAPLDGSKDDFITSDAPPVGTYYAPNLTPAGEIKDWSDGEIIRALREGVHKSGRPLIIMPAVAFHNLSDADAQAIVAYLRSQPATQNKPQTDTPTNSLNLLGALFIGAGIFPTSAQPPIAQPVIAPPEGTSTEYGKYLVAVAGCRDCHGDDLAGGVADNFGSPAGPNLTAIVPKISEADFIKTIRTGVDSTGKAIDPDQMPWKDYTAFATDNDLKAMYAYLHGLTLINKSTSTK